MSSWASRFSILLIVVVLGICFWRARTQSFTVDEAWVYNLFVSKELSAMAKDFDACNHVLHTLLMKLARYQFGGGELALRIPSLLGALIYCVAAFRLTRLLFSGWSQTLCLALLTLNPLILDFLVAARGYGLGLGLFLSALLCAMHYTTRGFDSRWLWRSGVLAGLAIAANLTLLIPVAALGLALLLLAARDGVGAGWHIFDTYGGPALGTAFLIVIIPMLNARPEHFYFGVDDLVKSIDSLTGSFLKNRAHWPARHPNMFYGIARFLALPVILLGMAAGIVVHLRCYWKSVQPEWRRSPFLLIAITLTASISAILALHFLANVRYPEGRTALYLIPLTFLGCFTAVRLLDSKRLTIALNVVAAVLAFICIRQTDNRYFIDWQFDSATRRMIRALEADFAGRVQPNQKAPTLGSQVFLRQTAIWYRDRYKLNWLVIPEAEQLESRPHDYYLLNFEEKRLVAKLGLQVIAEDSLSGEVLARRP